MRTLAPLFVSLLLVASVLASPLALKSALVKRVPRSNDVSAGLRGVLAQSGATYLTSVGIPLIISRLSGLSIPEVQGQASVPLLGTVTYTLTNIKVGTITFSSDSVSLSGGVQAAITGLSVPITLGWEYRQNSWPHIDSSGTADVSITDASLAIALTASIDGTGHPQFQAQNVVAGFDDISVKVHGSILSWLYDIIFALAKSTIKDDAAKAVETEVTTLVNTLLDQTLSKLDLAVPITNLTQLDLTLTQNPQFPSNYVALYFKGQIENKTNPSPCPLPHATLPNVAPSKMLELDVDEFLFNSGLWLIYNDGGLTITVNQSMIPPQFPFHLNTSTFTAILPALSKAYPNAGIEWGLSAAAAPSVTISPAGCHISALFDMNWLAGYPPAAFQSAFTTQVGMELDCFFWLNQTAGTTLLQGNMSLSNFSMTVTSSNIGNFDPSLMQMFFKAIFGGSVVSLINSIIEEGFPLPVLGGLSLINSELIMNQGYLTVGTDLHLSVTKAVLNALDRHVHLRTSQVRAVPRHVLDFDVLHPDAKLAVDPVVAIN